MNLKIDYDKIAGEYSAMRRASPRVVSHIIDRIAQQRIQRYLEVGCGTGDYLFAFKEFLKGTGYGFDRSPAMIEESRKKNPGLELKHGDAEKCFPFDDSLFGFVYSVNFIHYIKDLERYFGECFRVLESEGIVLSVTDSAEDIRERTLSFYFPETLEVEFARYHPIERITGVMTNAGFVDIDVTRTNYSYGMTKEKLESFRSKAYSSLRLIPQEAFSRGIARMEADFENDVCEAKEIYTYVWGVKLKNT